MLYIVRGVAVHRLIVSALSLQFCRQSYDLKWWSMILLAPTTPQMP